MNKQIAVENFKGNLHRTSVPNPDKTLDRPASPINNPNVEFLADNKGIYKRENGFFTMTACGFRIEKNNTDKKVKVILSQLPNHTGTSLTHMYEHFATDIFWLFLHKTPVKNIEWYDYWPKEAYKTPSSKPTLEKVSLEWKKKRFINPRWSKIEIPEGWKEKNEIKAI